MIGCPHGRTPEVCWECAHADAMAACKPVGPRTLPTRTDEQPVATARLFVPAGEGVYRLVNAGDRIPPELLDAARAMGGVAGESAPQEPTSA